MKTKRLFILIIVILVILIYQIPSQPNDFSKNYPYDNIVSNSLKEFRSRPTSVLEVDGTKWVYYFGGKGDKVILFLHGMGGAYDIWWQQINAFENQYKVLSYTLPEDINNLQDVVKGIQAILKKEQINKINIVGTSMGGYIAQYMVKTMPEKIEKAVFSNTFPPNDLQSEKNKTKEILVRLLPEILINQLAKKSLKEKIFPAAENDTLLTAFLPSLPFSKKGFIGRYEIVIDKFTINPETYKIKKIPKLIIESDNDPLVEEELRTELKNLYKDATVYTFHNKGHFPYINDSEKYNEILIRFFSQADNKDVIERLITQYYFEGRKKANIALLKHVFANNAKLYTRKEHQILEIPFEDYLKVVKQDGPKEINTQILSMDVKKDIAYCKTKFDDADASYIDYLTLIKTSDTEPNWKIVTKTFTKTK